MRLVSLLIVLALPLLEIGLLIKLGQLIGFWWTMALIVGTGVLGVGVLMENGISATGKIHEAMLRGEAPVAPLFDSGLMAAAGMLLITPGPIGDTLGLVLLIPPLRRLIARWIARMFFGDMTVEVRTSRAGGDEDRVPRGPRPERPRGPAPVIEGEYERLGERTMDPSRRKPDGQDAP